MRMYKGKIVKLIICFAASICLVFGKDFPPWLVNVLGILFILSLPVFAWLLWRWIDRIEKKPIHPMLTTQEMPPDPSDDSARNEYGESLDISEVKDKPPWFLKPDGPEQYKLCKARCRNTIRPDVGWYVMVETGDTIPKSELTFIETQHFKETWCGNPEEGPMLKYAKNHNCEFILPGDKHTSHDAVFDHTHTTATYFNRCKQGEKDTV